MSEGLDNNFPFGNSVTRKYFQSLQAKRIA